MYKLLLQVFPDGAVLSLLSCQTFPQQPGHHLCCGKTRSVVASSQAGVSKHHLFWLGQLM